MHLAFVSHEFPPDTGGGGIGTYLAQVTGELAGQGHAVEVFCGAAARVGTFQRPDGVMVHRLAAASVEDFRRAVTTAVAAIHCTRPFDVVEGNDFDAPALELKRAFPSLPCVIKLHTPRFAVDELHHRPTTAWQQWRINLGALRRGRWPQASLPIRQQPPARAELAMLAVADELAAPSRAIAEAAERWVPGSMAKTSVFPYAYVPPAALLALPPPTGGRRITFLGRLEERKGVIDLADAIPAVLAVHPEATFRFIGRAMTSPRPGFDMAAFLRNRIGRHSAQVEFTGPISPDLLPRYFGETDILAVPSHWESFGLVCCEGMAAARAVVGSASGGMVEIITDGRTGRLVPPHNPAALARTLADLLAAPDEIRRLGLAGRQQVLDHYAPGPALSAQLASYQRAIDRCRNTV